jgi:ribosomal protein S18 acetylase RimI-like enzyme
MTPCRIRLAEEEDISTISAIWMEFMQYHAQFDVSMKPREGAEAVFGDYLMTCLGDENRRLIVAEDRKDIIGYAMGRIDQRPPIYEETVFGFITDVAVTESRRREGIGSALAMELYQWFISRQVVTIEAYVQNANSMAMDFWQKQGFISWTTTIRKILPSDV